MDIHNVRSQNGLSASWGSQVYRNQHTPRLTAIRVLYERQHVARACANLLEI
jgi:hypothetical protein